MRAGLPFQYNPDTGDMRVSGTAASLAGLEQGLADGDANEIELAIRRLLLIHGIIMLIGGIPLIYLGDELGTLNDYSYKNDPAKGNDSRWVHRPRFNWDAAEKRHDPAAVPGRVYLGLQELVRLRQTHKLFAGGEMRVLDTGNEHLFAFERTNGSHAVRHCQFQRDAPACS